MRHIKLRSLWVSLVVFLPLCWEGITCQDTYHPAYSIQVASSVRVQEGLCVSIPCNFTADYRNTFTNSYGYWIKIASYPNYFAASNDKPSIVYKPNFHLTGNSDKGDCTLTIVDARKEDEGKYYFRFEETKDEKHKVKYNYHREVTISITVTVPTYVTITSEINGKEKSKQDSIIVDESSTVILRCSVQSSLARTVTWTAGGNKGLQRRIGKELELRLENVTMNHSGSYTCSAWKERVINSTTINITVQYPPRNMKITVHSTKGGERPAGPQVAINQTGRVTLICGAEGSPPVNVVWIREKVDSVANKTSSSGLSSMINVTSSMADVYRCLSWNALGIREQRIKVVTIQGSKDEQTTSDRNIRNISIAFLCGISITVLIILLYNLITSRKMRKKKMSAKEEEPSARAELPANQIYMNISEPGGRAEEATDNNIQLGSGGVTSDDNNVLYSIVAFKAKPKVPSRQPETEYAKVK